MKKLIIFVLLTIILAKNIEAQELLLYKKYINKAELFASDSLWNNAKEIYKKAFTLSKFTPFGTDLHNAMICSILTEDFDFSFNCAEELLRKGVDITYFQKDYFSPLRKHKRWVDFKAKSDVFLPKKNDNLLHLSKELESRYKKDQSLYEDRGPIFNANAQYLKTIIQNFGFPGESILGLEIQKGVIQAEKAYIMLLHWYSRSYEDYLELTPLLYNEVLKGNLRAEYFAGLPNLKPYVFSLEQNKLFYFYGGFVYEAMLSPEKELIVDDYRKDIGLHPFRQAKKVIRFFHKDKRFLTPRANGAIAIILDPFDSEMEGMFLTFGYKKVGSKEVFSNK